MILGRIYRPIRQSVTPVTASTELALMNVQMARRAFRGRPRVLISNVALSAIDLSMSTFQGIGCPVAMVEINQW